MRGCGNKMRKHRRKENKPIGFGETKKLLNVNTIFHYIRDQTETNKSWN